MRVQRLHIVSTLLPPVNGVQLPVMETLADAKRVAVAVVIGDFRTHSVTESGNACIRRLIEYMHRAGFLGVLHKVDVSGLETVDARVQTVLATAEDTDGALFVCQSSALFDAVVHHLNVGQG